MMLARQHTTRGDLVRLVFVAACVLGLCSTTFLPFSPVAFAAATSAEESMPEIFYARGCHDAASPDARETTGCFAMKAGNGVSSLPKSVVLSLQGMHLPTDLTNYRVLLQEYRRPSLLGETGASHGNVAAESAAAAAAATGAASEDPHKLAPILLLCERPSPSDLFPTQLITCELVNPLLTMNHSEVWRPQLQRLVGKTVWFDLRLEMRSTSGENSNADYRAVSVLRRAVQLQVTDPSHAENATSEAALTKNNSSNKTQKLQQRRAVSWEEVREHPLERLYAPDADHAANASRARRRRASSTDDEADATDLYERSDKVQNGEEVWVELGIGGLKRELRSLFRRVFLSRLPSLAPLAEALELQHVRGVILYGPPGNGKTLIARNLFRLLGPNTRLSVVNAADILSKFVGESEKNLRDVFEGYDIGTSSKAEDAAKDAESFDKAAHKAKDAKAGGGLQVLVIDEFEALFRRRGHSGDESSAKAVYDGVTNTLLSLMDGVKSRNDLLVVGLTNRLQAIDQALLRPGRFEVLIEIPAPDVPGREDIFFIHTDRLREHHFLAPDVDLHTLALESGGFSGSDIAGTVRSAVSYALLRYRKEGLFAKAGAAEHHGSSSVADPHAAEAGHRPGDIGASMAAGYPHADANGEGAATTSDFQVTRADFAKAMTDIRNAKDEASALSQLSSEGDGAGADVIDHDGTVSRNLERAAAVVERVLQSDRTMTGLVAITGAPGTGKSTVARALTRVHDFTTVRYFSCRRLTELRDREEQLAKLRDALSEASHTERGLVVLDDYDVLVDSMGSGGYAAMTLRGLLYEYMHRPGGVNRALVADSPLAAAEEAGGETEGGSVVVNAGSRVSAERNRRVLVLTSTLPSVLTQQQLSFDVLLRVHPVLRRGAATLLTEYRVVDAAHATAAAAAYPVSMSYRTFLRVTDMALQRWVDETPANATEGGEGQEDHEGAGVELPAYFATSDAMREEYDELQAAQTLANFYAVASDAANRGFVAAVRATTANMGLMDPYEGWSGKDNEDAVEGDTEDEDGEEGEEIEDTVDVDALVGAADELLW